MKTYIKDILEIRKKMNRDIHCKYSMEICEKVRNIQEYQNADTILFFYPYQNEVDILPLVKECFIKEKKVYFPKVTSETTMDFVKVSAMEEFDSGYRGILEPKGNEILQKNFGMERICMLVPGSVFDKKGNRCGYGKGYYDRYLGGCNSLLTTIGVCFSFQQIDEITDVKETDIKMDYVINEIDVLRSKRNG